MRAMKKMLISAAACGVLAAAVSASALCAQIDVTGGATYAKDNDGNYTVSVDASKMLTQNSGQMTVMVTKAGALEQDGGLKNDDILYIDQVASADGIFKNMGVKGKLEAGATYDVFVGGSDVKDSEGKAGFYRTSFTVEGNTIKWCDVNGDGNITGADATRLLRHTAGIESLVYVVGDEAANLAEIQRICDVNKDGSVTGADATRLLRHTAGIESIEELKSAETETE